MAGFGAFLAPRQGLGKSEVRGSFGWLGRVLPALFGAGGDRHVRRPRSCSCATLGCRGCRSWPPASEEGSAKGLYLAAKGGQNHESHNHNDVGSFIVYHDGQPVLIDVGVEAYTAKTFSGRRYEIWTMQSAYHNLPTINGLMQKEGRAFAAKDVRYRADERIAELSMDMAPAYPKEAGLRSWRRTLRLERGKRITVRDVFRLEREGSSMEWSFMTPRRPTAAGPGSLRRCCENYFQLLVRSTSFL